MTVAEIEAARRRVEEGARPRSDAARIRALETHSDMLQLEANRLRRALRLAHAVLDMERPHGARACIATHEPAEHYEDCSDCRWALVIDTAERALRGEP